MLQSAIKPLERLTFPNLTYFKKEVFGKSFSKWKKSLYECSYLPVLSVWMKNSRLEGRSYVVCMSIHENFSHFYESGRYFEHRDLRSKNLNLKNEIVAFIKSSIHKVNDRLKVLRNGHFQKLKYVLVNDSEIDRNHELYSSDFDFEECHLYISGDILLKRIVEQNFFPVLQVMGEEDSTSVAQEMRKFSQMIDAFKKLKEELPLKMQTISEFVEDVTNNASTYIFTLKSKEIFEDIIKSLLTNLHRTANVFDPRYIGKNLKQLIKGTDLEKNTNDFLDAHLSDDWKVATDYLYKSGPFATMFTANGEPTKDVNSFYDKFMGTNREFFLLAKTLTNLPACSPDLDVHDIFEDNKNVSVEGDPDEKNFLLRALKVTRQTKIISDDQM